MNTFDEQRFVVLQKEHAAISKKLALAARLGNSTGFFQYYFEILPQFPTQIKAYNKINELYFSVFGEYRYDSFEAFRKQKNRMLEKKII